MSLMCLNLRYVTLEDLIPKQQNLCYAGFLSKIFRFFVITTGIRKKGNIKIQTDYIKCFVNNYDLNLCVYCKYYAP